MCGDEICNPLHHIAQEDANRVASSTRPGSGRSASVSFDHEADRAERYPDGLDGNV
jgi:hypothetical protein